MGLSLIRDTGRFPSQYKFTGGTGRFTNATGEVNFLAVLDGLDFVVLFEGNIGF